MLGRTRQVCLARPPAVSYRAASGTGSARRIPGAGPHRRPGAGGRAHV